MTQKSRWMRTAHRAHAVVTVAVVAVLLTLNLTGVIDGATALRLFFAVEVPLLVVFIVLTVLRIRRGGTPPARRDGNLGILDRLVAEEPLLRPAVAEIRSFHSLILAVAGKRKVPPGATPLGYARGTMAVPVAFGVASLVEIVVVHLLVPWQWLRIVLLVISVWGVLFIAGFFASRVVHPHLVGDRGLQLRWGQRTVLTTPLANVSSVARHANHTHTHPHAEGDRLVLTQFQSTNVVVYLAEAVAADAPVPTKERPADFRVTEVQLHVDDPEAFVRALTPTPDEVTT